MVTSTIKMKLTLFVVFVKLERVHVVRRRCKRYFFFIKKKIAYIELFILSRFHGSILWEILDDRHCLVELGLRHALWI